MKTDIKQTHQLDLIEFLYYLKKKFILIVASCFTFFCIGIIYVNYIYIPAYTATGSIIINKTFNLTHVNSLVELIHTNNVMELASDILKNEEPINFDNDEITPDVLRNGISLDYDINSPTVYVSFTSSNSVFNDEIVNAVINATVIFGNENFNIFTQNLVVGKLASSSTFTGVPKPLLLFVFFVIGAFLPIMTITIYSVANGKVNYISLLIKDELCSCQIKKKQVLNDCFLTNFVSSLQDKIEIRTPNKSLKSIAFISPTKERYLNNILFKFVEENRNLHDNVLLLDFDNGDDTLEKMLKNIGSEKPFIKSPLTNHISIDQINDNLSYYYFPKGRPSIKYLKKINFASKMHEFESIYDIIFIKMPPSQLGEAHKYILKYADFVFVNVVLEKTGFDEAKLLLSDCVEITKANTLVNFVN